MTSHTIEIQAPVDRVWDVLQDMSHWSEWMPTVKASAPAGGTTPGGVGAAYDLNLGLLEGTITYTVTEEAAPTHLVISGRHLASTYTITYDLLELAPRSTRVITQLDASGIGGLTEFAGGFDGQLRGEAAALKARVEERELRAQIDGGPQDA